VLANIFDPLYQAVGWLLAILYLVPPHMLGISIILMTIIVMAIQFPLIAKQTRSMIQMQRVQPEIKRIQQKYKEDKAKQNEELLKFYQENKINPLAGCLPLLLIFPIGIAVFGTFRSGIENHIPREGFANELYVDVCGSAETPVDVCEKQIDENPPDTFDFVGLELNLSAQKMLDEKGVVDALPSLLLLGLVIFTGWYQVRQTQARQIRQGAPINKQMQTITRVMPLFFGFISYGLNTATTLYFAVSNGWRIGQQHFVLNKFWEEQAADLKGGASKSKPKSGDTDAVIDLPEDKINDGKGQPKGQAGGGAGNRPAVNKPSPHTSRSKKKRKR
jgi:YidC/Oxa1 family membrane protein insertase